MFRHLNDFYRSYEAQSEATQKVFSALEDANLTQNVAEGHRTLGRIAWHIVATIPEMMGRTGLGISSVNPEAAPPARSEEIVSAYRAVAAELVDAVKKNWTDETLSMSDDMYGEKWERGRTLLILIHHEIHHRGQMTVLLRQAGSKVPGIMGPSKEEWSTYGMEEPPY